MEKNLLTQLATLATFSSLCERTTWCGSPVSLSNSSEAESNSSSRTQKRGFIMPCRVQTVHDHARAMYMVRQWPEHGRVHGAYMAVYHVHGRFYGPCTRPCTGRIHSRVQTVNTAVFRVWMKTPLGMEADLSPGHIVLDGVPALRERGTSPPSFWPMSIMATVAHLSYCGAVVY